MRRWVLVLGLLLAACGEPEVDVEIPARDTGQHVLDQAGILDVQALESRLAEIAQVRDIVVLTYETPAATCGEAFRAAGDFVRSWEADVALVAVAKPGDFASDEPQRQRCLGVQPLEDRAISGGLRERIAEELIPPKASVNDWNGAFNVAIDALESPEQP